MKKITQTLFVFLGIIFPHFIFAQITVAPIGSSNQNAIDVVNNLVGQGVAVSNQNFVGGGATAGTSPSNHGTFNGGLSTLGITTGVVLSTGNINDVPVNNYYNGSYEYLTSGDADLTTLVGTATYDAIGIEFDFIPEGNYISFDYIFGSEEYNEWVNGGFNDVFAFFVTSLDADGYNYNKKNIAIVPGTASTAVAIDNVNNGYAGAAALATGPCTNCAYFRDNATGALSVEPDGFTTVLKASCAVKACNRYRLKLVVADVGDEALDSYVFLKEGSLSSPSLSTIDATYAPVSAGTDGVEGCNTVSMRFNLAAAAGVGGREIPFTLGGTANISADYSTFPVISGSFNTTYANKYFITVPQNQTYVDLIITPLADTLTEGNETIDAVVDVTYCTPTTQTATLTIKDKINTLAGSITNTAPVNSCNPGGITLNTTVSGGWLNGGTYTYAWSPSTDLSSSSSASPLATPAAITTYTVTIADACGATKTDSVKVFPFPLPTATLTGSDTICSNTTDSIPVTLSLTGLPPWNVLITDGTNTLTFDTILTSPVVFNVLPIASTMYTITSVTDIHCNGNVLGSPVTVGVTPIPSATMSGPLELCNTGTQHDSIAFALTGTAPWTICYSVDALLFDTITGISNTPFYVPVAPTQTTSYYLNAMNDAHCTGTVSGTTLTIKLTAPPVVNLGFDTLSCTGNFTLHAGNLGANYLWNTNVNTESIVADTTGFYSVTVTSTSGCTGVDTIKITIGSNPNINIGNDTTICSGSQITLHAGIIPNVTYAWNPAGNADSLIATQSGMYFVTVTDTLGCFSVDSINVMYSVLPIVDLGNDTLICTGSFTIHAGNPGASYAWNTSSTTESITVNTGGTYSVTVTNLQGCENADTLNIQIGTSPVINLGADTTICSGNNITLHAGIFPNATYNWSPAGLSESLLVTQTGSYMVTVSDSIGCAGKDSIHILISNPFSVNLGNDTTICSGSNLTVHAGLGATYHWNNANTNENITVTQTGIYSVTVTDSNLCSDSDSISVSISTLQQGQITGDSLLCEGFVTNYQIPQFPGHTYNWTVIGGSATSTTTNPISVSWGNFGSGSLTLTETETSTGCFVTTNIFPVTILAKPVPSISGDQAVCASAVENYTTPIQNGYTFSWIVTGGSIASGANTNTVTVNWGNGMINPGSVLLTENITNAVGCAVSAPAYSVVIFTQTPNLLVHDPAAVCAPGTVNITTPLITLGSTGIGGFSYWKDSLKTNAIVNAAIVDSTGIYYIAALNSCGETIKPVHVTINDTIPILIIHNPAPVCFPEGADLTAGSITAGSEQVSLIRYWADAQLTIPLAHPDSISVQGTYYITGYNSCGSRNALVYVTIHTIAPTLQIHNPDSSCSPLKVDITDSLVTAGSTNVFLLTYWSESAGITEIVFPESIISSGTYYIRAENACGDTIKPVLVFINPNALKIVFTITDASCSDGIDGSVQTAITGGHLPFSYVWNTSPQQTTPIINALESGTYILTITDAKGCINSDTAVVNEINTECLVVPSAFTPNNDGNNDLWEFKNIALYPDTKVEVYSRWGTLVFKSDDYKQGPWDGKYNGNDVPSGSYVYIVRQNNGYAPIQGTMTIIR